MKLFFLLLTISCVSIGTNAQKQRWLSLGGRSTISAFSDDGAGLGSGGQFRIQIANHVNTDWFADYIVTNKAGIRSEYVHIGWSVLFYPMAQPDFTKKFQPYILAGHCFDYNKKTLLSDVTIQKDRWGSAVQAGLGCHYNITPRFDLSLTCQYMLHLTSELNLEETTTGYQWTTSKHSAFEGHLLTTLSFNYKLVNLARK